MFTLMSVQLLESCAYARSYIRKASGIRGFSTSLLIQIRDAQQRKSLKWNDLALQGKAVKGARDKQANICASKNGVSQVYYCFRQSAIHKERG